MNTSGATVRHGQIRQRERPIAYALATVILLVATTLLLLTRAEPQQATSWPQPPRRVGAAAPVLAPGVRDSRTVPVAVVDAGRSFLAGYLAYVYGHAPASAIHDASPALARSLNAVAPRVTVAIRARDPRIIDLKAGPDSHDAYLLTATVTDGGVASYPLTLKLAIGGRRPLIAAVRGER
jgi:hypothetical protein